MARFRSLHCLHLFLPGRLLVFGEMVDLLLMGLFIPPIGFSWIHFIWPPMRRNRRMLQPDSGLSVPMDALMSMLENHFSKLHAIQSRSRTQSLTLSSSKHKPLILASIIITVHQSLILFQISPQKIFHLLTMLQMPPTTAGSFSHVSNR